MHVMIDIETLSTHPTAAFFEVAAVPFDLDNPDRDTWTVCREEPWPDALHLHIDPSNQLESGKFHADWDTLKWWREQPGSWYEPYDRIPTLMALQKLSNHFIWGDVEGVWSKEPSFDIAILEHAFKTYSLKAPWSFRNVWDVRTIMMLAGMETGVKSINAHNAFADANAQITDVRAARRILVEKG